MTANSPDSVQRYRRTATWLAALAAAAAGLAALAWPATGVLPGAALLLPALPAVGGLLAGLAGITGGALFSVAAILVLAFAGGTTAPAWALLAGTALLSLTAALVRRREVGAAAAAQFAREQVAELRMLLDNVPISIWVKDDRNVILRMNRYAARAIGLDENATNIDTYEYFPEVAKQRHDEDLAVLAKGEAQIGKLVEFESLEGRRGWARVDKVPYVDPHTGKRYVFTASLDITNLMQAQQALAESEQRFALATEGSSAGIWAWTMAEGDEMYCSPRFLALLGYQPNEIEHRISATSALIHPDDLPAVQKAVHDHRQTREPYSVEYRIRHKTLGYRWFHGTAQAVWDDEGNAIRMIGSIFDITERKEAERRAEKHARELERSNRDLEEFAYSASHDLRAPLRGIEALTHFLEEDLGERLDDGSREHLDTLRARVKRMEQLLENLLAYAQVGRAAAAVSTVDVAQSVAQCAELMAGYSCRIEAGGDLPLLETAAVPFEQVLRNLVDNACKYHDRDDGTVTVSAIDRGELYEFIVADDGPGIGRDYQERIFGMFKTLQRSKNGTSSGMGLAIIRKSVDYAGGRVWVESEPDERRGTRMHFTWPKAWPHGADGDSERMRVA